ncbi:hypothetical protein BofuT4_P096690.1 [Botrytis cinerea T4]|uniref:Uncharacterized protein n=1 Tax=Botryotinia fuckeliana (strain T4) TaxID=999810 RepID=G2YDW3_BOTF4|nr:hypothetical protein BofuT4_P096690.1 [Botrytis cinerea T4]
MLHQISKHKSKCASEAFAEKATWNVVEGNKPNYSLSTMCPLTAYGPSIHRLEDIVQNANFFGYADVHNVEEIHPRVCESAKAGSHRFLTTGDKYTYAQLWPPGEVA